MLTSNTSNMASAYRDRLTWLFLITLLCLVPPTCHASATSTPCSKPTNMVITYGALVTCTITPVGDRDIFHFQGTTGEAVEVAVVSTGNTPSTSPAFAVVLNSPSGVQIASSGGFAASTGFNATLASNGTYTIQVFTANDTGTGPYTLSLERVSAPPSPTAKPIVFQNVVDDQINLVGEVDLYSFNALAGAVVHVSVVSTGSTPSTSPAFAVVLNSPSGVQIASSGGFGASVGYDATLASTGTYTIQVFTASRTGTGPYALNLVCLVATCGAPSAPPTCQIGLTPASASVGVNGGASSLNIGLSDPTCAWTAASNASWVTFPGGSSGTGNGALNYSVAANTSSGVSRVGSITIFTSGAEATFIISESGTGCTFALPQASQAFLAAGGTGTATVIAPAGCTWTASSTGATGVTITGGSSGSGNGTVAYTVAANTSSLARTASLTIAGLPYTVTQAGTAVTVGCTASAAAAPVVALEGRTETLGDLVLNCAGLSGAVNADVVLSLNTNVSNALVSVSATDAVLTVNGANPQNGQITGYNSLRWLGVAIAPVSGGTATVRITGVRADASLLSAGANLQPTAITGLVSIIGPAPVPVSGAQQTLANASASLAFQKQQASSPTGGAQTLIPLVYQETRAAAFRAAAGGTPGTRLRMVLTNLPGTVQVYAPVFPNEGSSRAQLFSADGNGFGGSAVAGATMAGGTYQQLTVTGGTATATWVVLSADPSQVESLTFPLLVTNATNSDLNGIRVAPSLAPVSDFSGASAAVGVAYSVLLANPLAGVAPYTWSITAGALPGGLTLNGTSGAIGGTPTTPGTFTFTVKVTDSSSPAKSATQSFVITVAPLPRYRDSSVALKLVNLRMTTSVQFPGAGTSVKPGGSAQASLSTNAAVNVGSNVTFVSQLLNDTSDPTQTATNVIIRDNLPSGLNLIGCTASGGASCSSSGNQLLVNYGTLGPGQSATVTVLAKVGLVADGTVLENPVSAVSDQVNADLLAGTASSSFIVLNGVPIAVGSQPPSGSGSTQAFTFQFSNPSGYQSLGVVNVLINNSLDARNACYLAYVVPSTTLVLVDDAGDGGGPYAGSVALGSASAIQNSQCVVNVVSALGSGTTLSLMLNIAFKPAFGGNKITYVAARDQGAGNSDWQALGVWQAPLAPSGPIAATGVTPARWAAPAGTNQQFLITLTDSKGAGDFGIVNVLINNSLDAKRACYLAYLAASNTLLLVDDAGDGGGPYAGTMPLNGTNTGISNSQCAVNGAGSSVSFGPNTLTLTLNIKFTAAFGGNRIVWVAGRDAAFGNNTDWQALGTVQ